MCSLTMPHSLNMEAALLWFAALCFGAVFLFVVVALITKPYRMKKKAQREAEVQAKKLADIYGRVAVTRFKISGLEATTRRLDEARKECNVTK